VLRVSVGAPPVDGAANLALVRLLARELDRPASAVRLVAGRAGRSKVVEIDGLERSAIEARWPNLGV
jgi:uncharacterized protein